MKFYLFIAGIVFGSLATQSKGQDLGSLLREEKSLLDALDRYVFEVRRADAAVKSAETAKKLAEERLAEATAAYEAAQKRLQAAKERFSATLRLLAAIRPYGAVATLLLGPDGDDVVLRKVLSERLAKQQLSEIAELVKAAEEAASAQTKALAERASAHAAVRAEKEARQRLESEMQARKQLLMALERDREIAQQHAKELAEADRSMINEITSRLSRQTAPVPFEKLKGRVRNPLAGSRVAIPFGDIVHPRFKTVTPHPGVTLTYKGDVRNVRAVAFGKVVFAGLMRGFGLTVVLDHASGYFTVYAGLANTAVSEGQVVREGDILGKVERLPGDDAVNLYFEIRRGSDPLNPMDYLASQKGI